jgi:hypothetical protein
MFADDSSSVDPATALPLVRSNLLKHFSQLRNYTCHVVADRFRRLGNNSLDRQDRVQLEAAFVGDKELFSRPGETTFEDRPVASMVPSGMISNDAFGSYYDVMLSGNATELKYHGSCKKDGRNTFRYEFRVPQEKSQLTVRRGTREAVVGFKGNVWVDSETLDLVRLDWKTEHIPSSVGVSSLEKVTHYEIRRIGRTDFLLPVKSELGAYDENGDFSLNLVTLEACREFTGESNVVYDTPAEGPSVDGRRPQP